MPAAVAAYLDVVRSFNRDGDVQNPPQAQACGSGSSTGSAGVRYLDMFKKIGMNIDYIATDWGTMLQRRNNKGPVDQGGWSCFSTGWEGVDHLDPANHYAVRGNGAEPSAWPGWCTSARLEELRTAWFAAPNLAAQQVICREMQVQAMQDVPSIPLGQFVQQTAYRTNITGVLRGFPVFWNVKKG